LVKFEKVQKKNELKALKASNDFQRERLFSFDISTAFSLTDNGSDSELLSYLKNTCFIFLLILRLLRYIHAAIGSKPYLRIDCYNRSYISLIYQIKFLSTLVLTLRRFQVVASVAGSYYFHGGLDSPYNQLIKRLAAHWSIEHRSALKSRPYHGSTVLRPIRNIRRGKIER